MKKALYGLKQAPRAWYDLLSSFLLSQKFSKGAVDPTLFTQKEGKDILLNWPDGWVEDFPELKQIPNLMIDIEAIDKVCWVNSDNKEVNFSTKVAWLSLRDNGAKVQWSHVVWIMRWQQGANLKCPLCNDCEDSHENLFFNCSYSAKIWNRIKVKGKMENANSNLYKVVDKISERPSNNHIWRIIQRLIVSASVYFIWQERNKRLFQNEKKTPDVLCRNVEESLTHDFMLILSTKVSTAYEYLLLPIKISAASLLPLIILCVPAAKENSRKGLQVKQNKEGIFISQDKYVAEILKKFDLVNVKVAITPMETKLPLTKDEEAFDVDVHLYRSMIGSLMYLTASRPDIMYAVCVCSRFQVTPKTSHLNAVKRIFKYLKGKPNLGLWYPRESPLDLEAFSDSDYGGSNLDRKSTTGGCQFLGQRLISWQCKKQTIVATSTTEAEYVAAANCCGQVLWVQNQLLDYGFNFMNTKIHIDNESTICIVKNQSYILRPNTLRFVTTSSEIVMRRSS
ncbi:hypothetical protein Tco_1144924 [Tanacetum coccineum]